MFDVDWWIELGYDPTLRNEISGGSLIDSMRHFRQAQFLGVRDGQPTVHEMCAANRIYFKVAAIARQLGARSNSTQLERALKQTRGQDLFRRLTLEIDGALIELDRDVATIDGVDARPEPLDATAIERSIERAGDGVLDLVMLAVRAHSRLDQGTMVVSLATAVEVASYRAYEALNGPGRELRFAPSIYLGGGAENALRRSPTFQDLNANHYAAIHELWGTRNEFVHHARLLIRQFDGRKTRRERLRACEGTDLERFRVATLAAVEWLFLAPVPCSES